MTAETELFAGCHRFSLPLTARTQKKRTKEALDALKGLYPFEVKKNCVAVIGTDRKGLYDVYVSRTEIKGPVHTVRNAMVLVVIAVVLAFLVVSVHRYRQEHNAAALVQMELEKQQADSERLLQEKEKRTAVLQADYLQAKGTQYEKVYPRMERIYSVVRPGSTIENFSLEGDDFAIEVSTKDALGILHSFEESPAFNSVKMNRTTVTGGREVVTYTGNFSRFIKDAESYFSVDERYDFYAAEIARMNLRSEAQKGARLSDYIKDIREALHKHGCKEQYIQLRGTQESAEVEFFILSSSRDVLSFIRDIQESDENPFDIKQLRIRNNGRDGNVQTTIRFDSSLEFSQDGDGIEMYEDKEIPASEMDSIFYRIPDVRPAIRTVQQAAPQEKKVQVSANLKQLSYIGLTRTGGTVVIIAKDEVMNVIYKLPLVQAETEGNFCVETQNGYRARIRNEYYEVKK